MQVQVEKLEGIKRKLTISVGTDVIEKARAVVYERAGKQAKIPGFRPGKAPKNVLISHYGSMIEEETVNDVIRKSYPDALKKEDLDVVGHPNINVLNYDPQKELKYEATVELFPEVKLKNYSGFKLEAPTAEVAEKDVEQNISQVLEQYSILKERADSNHKATKGDILNIDFTGKYLDGTLFQGGSAKGSTLEIGSGRFIPGFEEKLEGKKNGDEFTFNITFPEDYHSEDLKGKEVASDIKVNGISEKILPEWNEELCQKLGVKSEDEFKNEIKSSLQRQKEGQRRQSLKAQLLDQLIKDNPFELPQFMIDTQAQHLMQDSIRDIKQRNPKISDTEVEEYFKAQSDQYRAHAEHIVRAALLLEEVAKKEKVEVVDADLQAKYDAFGRDYGQSGDQIKNYYETRNPQALQRLKEQVKEEKIVDTIISKCKVSEKK